MSSISDALKKAQQNRTGEGPGRITPPPPAAAPARVEPPAPAAVASRLSPTIPVVVFLAVVLVIVMVNSRRGSSLDPKPVAVMPAPAASSKPLPPIEQAVEQEPLPAVPGPTAPVDQPKQAPEGAVPAAPGVADEPLPELSGTFYSEQNPVAIINGYALKEGETVGSFRVVKILPRGVMLRTASGKDVELRLK